VSRRNRERKMKAARLGGAADFALFNREFEVVATDGGTEFRIRPDATFAIGVNRTRLIALLVGLGFVMLGIMGWGYLRAEPMDRWMSWVVLGLMGVLGLLFLLLAWGGGPKGAYLLRIGPGGEVSHQGPVAGPGEVVAVWVECLEGRDEDGDPYPETHLYLERRDGRITELPVGRFTEMRHFGLARALAARLAEALNVPLNDRSPPEAHSTAARRQRSGQFWGVVIALVVGVGHFLGGFSLLLAFRELFWIGLMFTASGSVAIGMGCLMGGWGWRSFGLIVGTLAALVLLVWRFAGGGQ
jgi:hypothetical protein